MKKLLLLALSGIILTATVFGQEKEKIKKVEFGVNAGINISRLVFDHSLYRKYTGGLLTRLNGNISVEFLGDNVISLQTGVGYAANGSKDHFGAKMLMDYVTIPVLVKFNPQPGGFSIFAGPEIAMLAAYKMEPKQGANPALSMHEEEVKKTDVSALLGLSIRPNKGHFVITGAIRKGFTNLVKDHSRDFSWISAKSSAYIFTVGYRF